MLTLIDADLVCYRCAASANNDALDVAIWRLNNLMHTILHRTGATEYEAYISGQDSFRKKLEPTYKANRVQELPIWLQDCREYILSNWKGKITSDGEEADDAIGRTQAARFELDMPTTCASLDKDMLQIPGRHYRWEFSGTNGGTVWTKPEEILFVTPLDGLRFFYKQMLIGDSADNVFGVKQIGPKKAEKHIESLNDEQEMFDVVRDLYADDKRFITNLDLLWILKKENECFTMRPQYPSLLKHELGVEAPL